MGGTNTTLTGPDFTQGVSTSSIPESGLLLGHANGEAIILARDGGEYFALSATCSHYGGPLAEGVVINGTVRCPWHHAAFELRTGAPCHPPALNDLSCFEVQRDGDVLRVAGKKSIAKKPPVASAPESVLVIGAGAAGQVAVETLRREGYAGRITMIGADAQGPVDRPNLSKDYLAGNAPEEWIPLRGPDFYDANRISLRTGVRATRVDPGTRQVQLSDGSTESYGALLLCTGAEPVRLKVPGAELPHVHVLRNLNDTRAIIAAAGQARTAAVIGSGFIGLEVAASLRTRGLQVHVITPDALPLQRVLGEALGTFVRDLHVEKGVMFHFRSAVKAIHPTEVELESGDRIPAELVVVGIGVRPNVQLAVDAGLSVEAGAVVVDEYLQTSAPSVFAAGDIASWPDARLGRRNRVEHWVVAERQGRTAALNMLGRVEPFRAAPFFWSQHYDVPIAYVGSGAGFDSVEVRGDPKARDCLVAYRVNGRIRAIATIYRDRDSLLAEHFFERGDDAALEKLVR